MKRFGLLILALFLVAGLASCNTQQEEALTQPEETTPSPEETLALPEETAAQSEETLAPKEEATSSPEETAASQEEQGVEVFNEEDMIFVTDGVGFPISTPAQPLLDLFGSEYELFEAPSCSFDGNDKQFVYNFATVYTYPVDGVDLINEIYIYGGDYETNRGIKLGDTLEMVIEAYGEGGFENGTSYAYALSGDPEDVTSQRIYFEFIDGVISAISYFGANGITL